MSKKFFITTPIYYVNDKPHIGHAYTTVAADVLTRWHKSQGENVFFSVGTDEHGAKIAKAAKDAGQNEQEFVDEKTASFKTAWKKLNINYSGFVRTTDGFHIEAVGRALQNLYDKKFIYQGQYEGLYCSGCEQYKNKDDLINGKCPEHQIEPELLKEQSYFFKLSQFGKILKEKIISDEFEIVPLERKNEVLSFINQGLSDISISRKNVKWGIPLPFDKECTLYVWVDAFLNYLTVLGWNGKNGKSDLDFWPPDLQLMSKDILRVHATIWPALLSALGFSLPKKIFVHGYFTTNGQKMSKSLGNVIWPEELIEKFGADAARYLLMSLLSFGQDADASWDKLTEKYNADLANGVGNLFSRVLTMAKNRKIETEVDPEIKNSREEIQKIYSEKMGECGLSEALGAVLAFSKKLDQYINLKEPWRLLKDKDAKLDEVLGTLIFGVKSVIFWLKPFMPEKMEQAENYLQNIDSQKEKLNLFPRI